jgi:hypothetical protein
MSGLGSVDKIQGMDRRLQERHLSRFQVRLTDLASPEVSASGQGIDISEFGIGVYLPLKFIAGSAVELNINDSALFGVVTYSEREREILSRFYVQEQTKQEICLGMGLTHTQYRLLKWRSKVHFGQLSRKQIASLHLRSLCANNPH